MSRTSASFNAGGLRQIKKPEELLLPSISQVMNMQGLKVKDKMQSQAQTQHQSQLETEVLAREDTAQSRNSRSFTQAR